MTEQDVRLEINETLKNKHWKLTGSDRNVFTEKSYAGIGRADYVLLPKNRKNPLIIIEAKRKGQDLNSALEQAKRYAVKAKAPIVIASDGSTVKTFHMDVKKPLMLNGDEVDEFISETLALQYLYTNEYNTLDNKTLKSRGELITIFSSANQDLRREGIDAGKDRFSEFCNILFLKLFSEDEVKREKEYKELRIKKQYRWDYFKNKDGDELLSYVNDTVIKHFQKVYGEDIFKPLQIKYSTTLKKIIDRLDPLSLIDTNSDIKGDTFEYFLKAYLADQKKDLGEYFTPRHIVKMLVKFVNPRLGEKVYDPFCGTGGFLIESFKHIYKKMPKNDDTLKMLKSKTVYGGEVSNNARTTKMNMILTGDGHNNIQEIDSLEYPVENKYDVVITNMPFGLGVYEEYTDKYFLGSANADSLCIEHCFQAINKDSSNPRICIIVPEGILFDKSFTKLRDFIYSNSYVENIISLPVGSFKPYTDSKASILYMTKVKQTREKQKTVWHFTVNNDGYTLNNKRKKKKGTNDLDTFLSFHDSDDESQLLQNGFDKMEMEELEQKNYISLPNQYKTFDFESKFELIKLQELIKEVDIKNADNYPVWSVTNKNNGSFEIQTSQFKERVASVNTEHYKVVPFQYFAYSPPRINVGSIAFNYSKDTGCVSPMYVVFKIIDEKFLNPKYLYFLFRSNSFKQQIKEFAFGSVRQTVKFKDFCRIKIPIPSLEEQWKIVQGLEEQEKTVEGAKQYISNYKPKIKIKQEWDKVKLKKVCQINPSKKEVYNLDNIEVSFLPMEDLPPRTKDISTLQYKNKDDVYKGYTYFRENDLLIAKITPCFENGKMAIVKNLKNSFGFGSTEYIVCRNKSDVLIDWVYYYLRATNYINQGKPMMKGTVGQKRIPNNFIEEYTIHLPSLQEQKEIVQKLESKEKMIEDIKKDIKETEEEMKDKINSLWETQ